MKVKQQGEFSRSWDCSSTAAVFRRPSWYSPDSSPNRNKHEHASALGRSKLENGPGLRQNRIWASHNSGVNATMFAEPLRNVFRPAVWSTVYLVSRKVAGRGGRGNRSLCDSDQHLSSWLLLTTPEKTGMATIEGFVRTQHRSHTIQYNTKEEPRKRRNAHHQVPYRSIRPQRQVRFVGQLSLGHHMQRQRSRARSGESVGVYLTSTPSAGEAEKEG